MARPDQVFHLREAEKELGFAQAVRTGDTLYVAGTCCLDLENNILSPGDMRGQLEATYRNIERALEAHDADFGNVVKEVIYVTDIDAFRAALPARRAIYGEAAPPAATWVEVTRLMRPEFMIEVEVTAVLDQA
ncbi:MAG: RidA family protein [Alphaproteobacteria bacterium]|nr:RidA family protein [Alphaproteobacteria bacterium]